MIFFWYVAGISLGFHMRSQEHAAPFMIAAAASALMFALSFAEANLSKNFFTYVRDWVTLALVLVGYRLMDWYTPQKSDQHLEKLWIVWDRWILHGLRLVEFTGPVLPGLLELSYLVVYAVGPFTVATLYVIHQRPRLGWVLFVYVVGTVAAYGLFPYFPSDPPRTVFPGEDLPQIVTPIRQLNLWLVGNYGIHSSVFPSAHVSSAFSAAWAMLIFLPDRKKLGRGMVTYAVLVSIATVYGRYHYAADVLGGFAISIGAAALTLLAKRLAWTRAAD
jgi:membrane-associated phospholipid phosphatase